MFNVYEFDRRCSNIEQQRKMHVQSQLMRHRQTARNKELNVAYRQRVGKFIKKMIQDSAQNPELSAENLEMIDKLEVSN